MPLDVVKCDGCGHVLPRSITEEFGWLLLDEEMDVWLCPKCEELR